MTRIGKKPKIEKGRLKKLARTHPNNNNMEVIITDNLSGTKRRLWNEEEATNEGRQKKLCIGESNPFDIMTVAARQHRREP